jgi:hypothetical protein
MSGMRGSMSNMFPTGVPMEHPYALRNAAWPQPPMYHFDHYYAMHGMQHPMMQFPPPGRMHFSSGGDMQHAHTNGRMMQQPGSGHAPDSAALASDGGAPAHSPAAAYWRGGGRPDFPVPGRTAAHAPDTSRDAEQLYSSAGGDTEVIAHLLELQRGSEGVMADPRSDKSKRGVGNGYPEAAQVSAGSAGYHTPPAIDTISSMNAMNAAMRNRMWPPFVPGMNATPSHVAADGTQHSYENSYLTPSHWLSPHAP